MPVLWVRSPGHPSLLWASQAVSTSMKHRKLLVWKENGTWEQILVKMHYERKKFLRPGLWKATEVLILTRHPLSQFQNFNFWCFFILATQILTFQGCWTEVTGSSRRAAFLKSWCNGQKMGMQKTGRTKISKVSLWDRWKWEIQSQASHGRSKSHLNKKRLHKHDWNPALAKWTDPC